MTAEKWHYPDLSFQAYCKDHFGVNRGIYNTVEEWFFSKGFHEIVERRKLILDYFAYTKNSSKLGPPERNLTFFKVGKGELIPSLESFFRHYSRSA